MISGKPVKSSIARTSKPPSRSAAAVPPVEMSSTPRLARPRAKSTTPVLLETDRSARFTRTSPGCTMASIGRGRYLDTDEHPAGVGRVMTDGSASDDADGVCDEVVLEGAEGISHFLWVGGGGEVDGALEDDRPGVHALVHEVDGHAEHLHAVGERLLDGADAGEGRQQRRVDVDDALGEGAEEGRREQRHVAGQHDELH